VGAVINLLWLKLVRMFAHPLHLPSCIASSRRPELLGLVCVVTLLFPAISVNNDDLAQPQSSSTGVPRSVVTVLTKADALSRKTLIRSLCPCTRARRVMQYFLDGKPVIIGATGDRSPPCVFRDLTQEDCAHKLHH
jgi:hypothetical protein